MIKGCIWWVVKACAYLMWLVVIGYAVVGGMVSVVALITNTSGMFSVNMYPLTIISCTAVLSTLVVHWHVSSRIVNARMDAILKRTSDFVRLRPDGEWRGKQLNIALDFDNLFCKNVDLAKQLATVVIQEGHKIGVVTRRPRGDEAVEFFTDIARCQPYYIGSTDREEFFAEKGIDIHVWIG